MGVSGWMSGAWAAVVLAALGFTLSACLGGLPHDGRAKSVATAARDQLGLPLHEHHRSWLLRDQDGWCGAAEARFGGDPDDPAVATIRAVRFRSPGSAQAAVANLTPTYIHRVLRDRMTAVPRPTDFPVSPRGDDFRLLEYGVRLPPEVPPEITLTGQLTTLRAGPIVLLVESIGLWPEPLATLLDQLLAAAARLPASGC